MGSLAKGLGRGAPRQVVLMQARAVPRTGSSPCRWLDRGLLWLLVEEEILSGIFDKIEELLASYAEENEHP